MKKDTEEIDAAIKEEAPKELSFPHYHCLDDFLPQILSYLPSKSLLKFRTVAKPWKQLIDSTAFAHLHLKTYTAQQRGNQLLTIQNKHQECTLRDAETFARTSNTIARHGEPYHDQTWYFLCSLDGLIMLTHNSPTSGISELKLWNPSIHKFHKVRSLQQNVISLPSNTMDVDLGLGYDQNTNDHKHVKLLFSGQDIHSIAIYSLQQDRWDIIPNRGTPLQWSLQLLFTKVVHFKGALHFTQYDRKLRTSKLITFTLQTAILTWIPCPHLSSETHDISFPEATLLDSGETLAISDFATSIWELDNTEQGIWSQRYTLQLPGSYPAYIRKNNTLIMQLYNQHNTHWYTTISVDIAANKITALEASPNQQDKFHAICGYEESLLLLH